MLPQPARRVSDEIAVRGDAALGEQTIEFLEKRGDDANVRSLTLCLERDLGQGNGFLFRREGLPSARLRAGRPQLPPCLPPEALGLGKRTSLERRRRDSMVLQT